MARVEGNVDGTTNMSSNYRSRLWISDGDSKRDCSWLWRPILRVVVVVCYTGKIVLKFKDPIFLIAITEKRNVHASTGLAGMDECDCEVGEDSVLLT
ncbi:unnamed protein product [Sphenostylis stenocarpa]|uniref:Uncharacterized protein n=1 Tax=Sphenostylis stenocarpa TaxID=92480 RepID=A0AA86RWC6_9FABA|nr:unnamed protein product [Sphenostylis stenocarpa]